MIELRKYADDWTDLVVDGVVLIGNHSLKPQEIIETLIDKGVINDTFTVTEIPSD